MEKIEIQSRIQELDALIQQQTQLVGQVNNNLLMLHGARQELDVWVRKILDKEEKELNLTLEQAIKEDQKKNDSEKTEKGL